MTFISGHSHGFPWCISDPDYVEHTWCLCVVSSVLSFICDHVRVLIATGAQAPGLFFGVDRCDGKFSMALYLFKSVILLHILQRLCIICVYSVVFDTTVVFYNAKVFSTVNREILSGSGGLYVHVLFDTFVDVQLHIATVISTMLNTLS